MPRSRLRGSAAVQLGAFSIAGVMIVLALYWFDDPPAEPALVEAPSASRFPTLEIDGAPPVTEEEIARRMRIEPNVPDAEESLSRDDIIREELKAIAELGRENAKEEDRGSRKRSDPPERRKRSDRTADSASRSAVEVDPPKRRGGRWFSPGGTVKVEKPPSSQVSDRLPLAVGERLSAKLEVGISTGHSAPVLARLTKEVRVAGRLIAPEGTIAKGRFQSDALRVYVTFTELILPSAERLQFEGYAVDRKIPGLVANRVELPDDGGGRLVQEGMDVAKEVARSVASGSIVGRLAQGAVDGALPEKESGRVERAGFVLEVAAGKTFQIVITGAEP